MLSPAITPWVAGLVLLAFSCFVPGALGDGDTFTHLAAGGWMLDHGAVLDHDPFSYTRNGAPWLAHEWLAEVILAACYRLAGWGGLVALTGLAVGLTFLQMTRHLQRWLPGWIALLIVLLAANCIVPSLLARPHILALPVFEAWVAGLLMARAAGRAPPWHLLPVMSLWANLHGGFIIGLLLVLPLGLEAVLERRTAWRGWTMFLLGAIVAATVTPHGLDGLLFPFRLAGTEGLSRIGEWQPTDFSTLQSLELTLGVGLFFALSRGVRLPVLRLLMLLGLLHAALQHTRHEMLLAVIAPLLLAAPLSGLFPVNAPHRKAKIWQLGGVLLALALVVLRLLLPVAPPESATAPIAAVAHVPAGLRSQPMFNDYAFGGYLTHAGLRPFIDGRLEVFGAAFLQQYLRVTHPDKATMDAVFQRYGVTWTILAPGNPAVALLDVLPGWCRVYADKFAVIQTRVCN